MAGLRKPLSTITNYIAAFCGAHMTPQDIRSMVLNVAARRSFAARDGELHACGWQVCEHVCLMMGASFPV